MQLKKRLILPVIALALFLGLKAADTHAAAWMETAKEYTFGDTETCVETGKSEDEWGESIDKYYFMSVPTSMKTTIHGELEGSNTPSLTIYDKKGNIEKSWDSEVWEYDPYKKQSTLDLEYTLKSGIHYFDFTFYLKEKEKLKFTFNTNGNIDSKPFIKSLKKKNGRYAKIAMKRVSNTDGCLVYMKTGKKGKYKLIKKLKGSGFITKKLKRKQTYYFRCKTYVKIGEKKFYSPYSSVKKIKIK